jgi:hypothetical protein
LTTTIAAGAVAGLTTLIAIGDAMLAAATGRFRGGHVCRGVRTYQAELKEDFMSDQKSGGAKGLILILHALVWAAAMIGGAYFFKDQPWGDDLVLWMIVGFTAANGLLMTAFGGARPRC